MLNSHLAPDRLTCWENSTLYRHLIAKHKKAAEIFNELNGLFDLYGRDGVIRTLDPLHTMQVRYRAALRPDDVFTRKLKTKETIP